MAREGVRNNPLHTKRGRSGIESVPRFILMALAEPAFYVLVGAVIGFVLAMVGIGGCEEGFRYANNHGW